MPAREKVILVVGEWVIKAENDLKNAAHALRLGGSSPTDTVCFHAQQCIEKYLKALLVLEGIDFPKTHDVKALMALLPRNAAPNLEVEEQERITDYAIGPRYHGWPEISLAEARRAVALAPRAQGCPKTLAEVSTPAQEEIKDGALVQGGHAAKGGPRRAFVQPG